MTLACKLPIKFNVILIAKYLELSESFIQTIKCGNNSEICRTLVPIKHKNKKPTKKNKKNFYNQVTIVINCVDVSKINVKLFKNGSIQITGCKNISSVIWILKKLFFKLQEPVQITEESIIETNFTQTYADPYIFLNIMDISDLKIAMINSNFDIGFNIDREKLFDLLISNKYDCEYDPSRHAGVKIRYKVSYSNEHSSSIFVFDKGSIIITGAQNYLQIMECYKFINIYLIENYVKIVRIPMI
jgi:TATA-box binding protein (TBP) (component of TFIID and TFIIIB)